jgi:dethiobiotin synthetase
MIRGLFVTGTDTGVGKTQVTAAIARCLLESGHRVGAIKPVATGVSQAGGRSHCGDAAILVEALGGGIAQECVVPLRFSQPLAPPIAARIEEGSPLAMDRVIEAARVAIADWAARSDVLLVEGVGGFLCPLAESSTVADLAVELDFPVLIVARRSLGTLNHTLLTVEVALRRGVRVAGVVLNATERSSNEIVERTNFEELSSRLNSIPILSELSHQENPASLFTALRDVDWYERARAPRRAGDWGCRQ